MPASFQEIINSRLFKFIVGEAIDGKATNFSVHEDAVAYLSIPLESLVKGSLAEAQAACTIWKDVKKDTFERFVQFAYTGDYSIPETEKRKNPGIPEETGSEEAPVEEQEAEVDPFGWGSSFLSTKIDAKKGVGKGNRFAHQNKGKIYPEPFSTEPIAADFASLQFPLLTPRNKYETTTQPNPLFKAGRSYSNVFLAHASLYTLGDYWLIDTLTALALHKLHKTLCIFQLDDSNVEDVVELARYAYSDEGKGAGKGLGGLRDLVCQYLAANAVVLALDEGFMDFLAEGGQFVKDFVRFEIQRMH